MSFLDEINQTYQALSGWLGTQEAAGRPVATLSWLRMAELNDYAFFILLFGQLEDCINQEFEQTVGPWEDAAFEHRVNVLFGRLSAPTQLIMDYYELRCAVAHGHAEGGQMGRKIHMQKVYDEIQALIAQYDA